MNFTFKKGKNPTGLSAVTDPYARISIKLNNKVVGDIIPPNWRSEAHEFRIAFYVKDAEPTCGWKRIQLKFRGKTEQETRDFIKNHSETLQAQYQFHYFDSQE